MGQHHDTTELRGQVSVTKSSATPAPTGSVSMSG